MDWRDTPEQQRWRNEVRTVLETELPEPFREATRRGEEFSLFGGRDSGQGGPEMARAYESWRKSLSKRGWIAPHWPKEYGGAGLSPVEQFIMTQEFAEAGAPPLGGLGVTHIGPTLIAYGTEEQKKEHLGRILDGSVVWCQGYSEPGAGSDLASLQTRAVRDGDDFVINGQKIWTSGAHQSDWMFCLVRTDPEAPKHRGITYLLIDMKAPGVSTRPLVNMANHHHFNEVFFEDVRVPVTNAVGEINRGWYVGAATLDYERSSIGIVGGQRKTVERSIGIVGGQRKTVERYIGWLRDNRQQMSPATYVALRNEWAERWVEMAVAIQLSYRVISMQASGLIPNSEASITKLYSSELTQRVAASGMKTLGMMGAVRENRAPMEGRIPDRYMTAVSSTIAGGTSEIMRNIIATRGLGLPRG
ncbi:MAG: acyl-CoA dehydrogenase family protein [Hyphomicrobiales bacterium]